MHQPATDFPRSFTGRSTPTTRLLGLDGVRALSIAAVIGYHADLVALPGGFLGVEVFFVLSGFLVGGTLIAELERRHRIHLRGFAVRRARRLAPALLAMLGVVASVVLVWFRDDQADHLRRGAIGAVTGTSNWLELFAGGDYFAGFGRGPVLKHLWSFAVEVQAYALMAVAIPVIWRIAAKRRGTTAMLLAGLATLSYLWQAVADIAWPDGSRAYFGTDTRIGAILLGAALSAINVRDLQRLVHPFAADAAGLISLVGLGVLVATTEGTDQDLHQGVLAVTAVLAVLVVSAIISGDAKVLTALLGSRPLTWVGTRSYGLYLWHWPLFVLTRPIAGDPMPWVGFAARVAATAVLAEASYRWIEHREPREEERWSRRRLMELGLATLCGSLIVGVATASPLPVPVQKPPVTAVGSAPATAPLTGPVTPPSTPAPSVATTTPTSPTATSPTTTIPTPSTTPATTTSTTTSSTTVPVSLLDGTLFTFIGDSVMMSGDVALRSQLSGAVSIDAKVGRQFGSAIDIVRTQRAEGRLAPRVVIGLGTNGPIQERDVVALMAELGDRERVTFVLVEVPRRWERSVNATLRAAQERYPTITLADWPALVKARKLSLPDGVHPAPKAAVAYATLVLQAASQ